MDKANASPVSDGKAAISAAEEAYDKLAAEKGIDEHGDPVIDDDEPVTTASTEEIPDDDGPVTGADDDEPQPDLPAAAQSGEDLLPPHTWREEWKEQFSRIQDPAMKKAILETNRNMNAAFTQRMTELAGLKRKLISVENAMQPHLDRLHRAGIQPEVAVQRALAWDAHIQQNPEQGILDMAKAYGVDLTNAAKPSFDEQYLTPFERAQRQALEGTTQTVQQLQQQWAQWQQYQQQQTAAARQANAKAMLDEFKNAKDEAGNPKHPYIEHVAPMMAQLIRSGIAPDLETAYGMAEKVSPEVQAARERQRNVARQEEARQQAEKVRKASSGIVAKTGKGSGKVRPERDIEDQVAAAYDKLVKTA